MAKTRQQKEQAVKELAEKLSQAKAAVITAQRGLTVSGAQDLRRKCREENVEYFVTKKTLLQIALKEAGIDSIDMSAYDGIVGVAIGFDDEVAPARITHTFAKDFDVLQLHAGVLEGAAVGAEKVQQLASLPSKEELLAKFVGSMNAPVSGFVGVLSNTMSGFVRVLDQVREQKEA
jgi:large subunit ribosomal protein L10